MMPRDTIQSKMLSSASAVDELPSDGLHYVFSDFPPLYYDDSQLLSYGDTELNIDGGFAGLGGLSDVVAESGKFGARGVSTMVGTGNSVDVGTVVSASNDASYTSPGSSCAMQMGSHFYGTGKFSKMFSVAAHVSTDQSNRKVLRTGDDDMGLTYGYCYLSIIKHKCYKEAVAHCGRWPTVMKLLSMPASWMLSFDVIDDLVVYGKGDHVGLFFSAVVNGGMSFTVVLSYVASLAVGKVASDTFLHDVLEWGSLSQYVYDAIEELFSPETIVGGGSSFSEFMTHELKAVGVSVSAEQLKGLSFCTKSIASYSSDDKRKMRMYEVVGDSALTHALARRSLFQGFDVQRTQACRTYNTNNARMSSLFVKIFDAAWFTVPSGVDVSSGKVGASFVEAILGYVDYHIGFTTCIDLITRWNLIEMS